MHRTRPCIIFCLLLLIPVLLGAREQSLYFDRLTTENGLSNNKVNCILQDRRGFIWIGTDDGLNRFDGHHFIVFQNQPGNSSTISGNLITDLLEDDQGVIWIATADGGLSRYDYRLPPKQQFRQYRHNPLDSTSIPGNFINALSEDRRGYLWLATSGYSVLRFNKKEEIFERPVLTGTRTALDMTQDKDGILWVGRQGGGILKVNTTNLDYSSDERYLNLYAKLPHATVTSLYNDRQKHIWFGSWDKVLYRFDPFTGQEHAYPASSESGSFPGAEVLCFSEDIGGRLWMGTRSTGLVIFDRHSGQFANYRHDPSREGTIADNQVNCVYIDKKGRAWLGTNRGISISNPEIQQFNQQFLNFPSTRGADLTIYDFLKNPSGSIYIGTSDGIFIRRRGETEFRHLPLTYKNTRLAVSKFYRDVDGRLFLGTNFSVFILDERNLSISLLPNTEKDTVIHKIIDSRVVSMIRDTIGGHPVLMASPYGHFIVYYDFTDMRWVSRLDTSKQILLRYGIKDNLIRKFHKSTGGMIWMATVREGMGEWDTKGEGRVVYHKNNPMSKGGISNNHIYDVNGDGRGNMWVSTYGGGLHYYNSHTHKFYHIPGANNLLEGIQTDRKGNVWMISNGNLHQYDPRTRSLTSYNLPDVEKSGGIRGYIYKDSDGIFYVAGTNYFISFDPDSIKSVQLPAEVYLTDFRIFNRSYSDMLFRKKITLSYDQNYFTFEFAAPTYSSGNMLYSCKLEGWDKEWVEMGTRNFTQYSNLDGGKYTFRVRATKNPGVYSDEGIAIPIQIIPPFWKEAWFYALCFVGASLLVYGIYRYRINELVRRQEIRNRIAQDLHDNVGSTLSSVAVYSQVAQIQNEQGDRNSLVEVLQKISRTSDEMISEMNDIVWTINPRNDSMEKIFQRMESFSRPLASAKNIKYTFNYDKDILALTLGMETRKNFYLIFKESLNNSIKYSGATKIWVNTQLKNHSIEFVVSDNGAGFDPSNIHTESSRSMSGNGLKNMERRAREMKGKLTIHSSKDNGTEVKLVFPIT